MAPNSKFKQYLRLCKRCDNFFYTIIQKSNICPNCHKKNTDTRKRVKHSILLTEIRKLDNNQIKQLKNNLGLLDLD